jgi:hypothetical protein
LDLKTGDRVKLHFVPDDPSGYTVTDPATNRSVFGNFAGESMWVEVTNRIGDVYVGILVTERPVMEEIKPGDKVHFEARHVHQVGGRTPWLTRMIKKIVGPRWVK